VVTDQANKATLVTCPDERLAVASQDSPERAGTLLSRTSAPCGDATNFPRAGVRRSTSETMMVANHLRSGCPLERYVRPPRYISRIMSKPKQLSLALRTHGGVRRGAGRKPNGDTSLVSHAARPRFDRPTPAHVTLRVVDDMPSLRASQRFRRIQACFLAARRRFGLRLVEFNVLSNHLHLVVEADDAQSLSRGLQGLAIRIAKALNRLLDRRGNVFADHYHLRLLPTPTELTRAIRYVLDNAGHHYGSNDVAFSSRAPGAFEALAPPRGSRLGRGRGPRQRHAHHGERVHKWEEPALPATGGARRAQHPTTSRDCTRTTRSGWRSWRRSPPTISTTLTGEDNGDAHHKRQVMGREVVVAVTNGTLDFGPWEQIFYGEFDGRRDKRVLIKVIGD
jgi:putative transposase